jgi:hypothetical protein
LPAEGLLLAAILHAGAGSGLSHRTAAWWWQLLPEQPPGIDVSTPTRARSTTGVIVHHPRTLVIVHHNRLPVTTLAQTLLDLAATASVSTVRYALANAEFHHRGRFNLTLVRGVLGRGHPGSATLRAALDSHQPRLAYSRSKLERDFIALCERYGIPLPQLNVRIHGYPVDAIWRRQRLIVELDGIDNHSSDAQVHRDRSKDLTLRRAGFVTLRYSHDQVHETHAAVAADVLHHLELAEAT